ncbi:MAG: DUF1570 domain-containing protein [Phycisphaerae bacterium]|nr:DUF1570 domain-containing protein [Phycisphaerae bacterium]
MPGPGLLPGASFETTATEHFVLFHEPDAGYVAGACRTLEYAYGHFYEVFSLAGFDLTRSEDRLVWLCFPQKSTFSEYALQVEGMDLSWLDGYYSTLTNRVAIVQTDQKARLRRKAAPEPPASDVPVAVAANRSPREGVLPMSAVGQRFDVTRLTHEVAHQLSFNSGIQKRGVAYPLWVSEGLATNFEFDTSVTAGLAHGNAARCQGLLEAYAEGNLVPLRQFVVQTTVPPDAQVGRRYYAQAWGFFQFVLTERPENLRTYLDRLAQTRPEHHDERALLAEFTEAFGAPEVLELSWNAFLASQAQQVSANRTRRQ